MSALPARRLPHSYGLLPCRHARSASGDGPCVPSWTRQFKAANEDYAALNAKYLETDGAKQFIAEQQTAIAAAAECEVESSEAEDEGEEEQSATIKRKRRAPKQKKDPNGAVGALAATRRANVLAALPVCGLSKQLPHIDVCFGKHVSKHRVARDR